MESYKVIGNSTFLRLPAKLRKKRGITKDTMFEIVEEPDGIKYKIVESSARPDLPKVHISKVLSSEMGALIGAAKLTVEDIENDERLKYILSK